MRHGRKNLRNLNGIDADWRYNNHDKSVKFPYNHVEREIDGIKYLDWKEGKKLNKRFLQKKLGLKVDENIPLLSFIGRIDPKQKGFKYYANC